MGIVSPGFSGRRRDAARICRPGSTWSRTSRCCPPGRRRGSCRSTGSSPSPPRPARCTAGTGRVPRTAERGGSRSDLHCVTRWSKLGTGWQGVSLDTLLADVETGADYALVGSLRRLHHEPAARRPARRPGLDRVRLRRGRPGARARRPGPAAGAAPVPVEERQVGPRDRAVRHRRARASGRPPATTTTETHGASSGTPATDLAGRHRRRGVRRDRDRPDARARRAGLARSPGRAARRRPADRAGRLPRVALVLDRVDAGPATGSS